MNLVEIYPKVWIDPMEVSAVYLRSMRGQEDMTVVVIPFSEIRLPGDLVDEIRSVLERE